MEDRDDAPVLTQLTHSMQGIPDDARMLGLDRNTQEGALVAMAGSLNGAKLSHRIVAWALLVAFVGPGLVSLLHNIF